MNISGSTALTDLLPIYYRAFDSYPNILDCIDFFDSTASASNLIQQLLKNQAFEQTVQLPSSSLHDDVKSLFFEAYNQRRLRGDAVLGIGYPMLYIKHPRQLILAPLLIWPVQLEPHLKEPGKWVIRYRPSHKIQINPYLLHYWQTYFGWNQQEIIRNHKTYPSLLQKTINELLNKLMEELGPLQQASETNIHTHPPFSIHPLPKLDSLGELQAPISVYWSGVLGIFPPIFPHLPINIAALKTEELPWKDSPLGINIIAPPSASALGLVRQYKSSHVQARFEEALPLLIYLMSNILSNGRTAIIVSTRQSYLHKTLQLLSQYQLEEFAFLFQNKREDWPLLRQLILKGRQKSKLKSYDNDAFENLQSQLIKLESRMSSAYQAGRQVVFNGMNFRETLGCYFHHQKKQAKELLNSQLEEKDYVFSQAEYEEISKAIGHSFPLYQQINTLHHPLEILHPSILEQEEGDQALEQLSDQLDSFKRSFTKLQHRYIAITNQYAERLHKYYQEVFRHQANKHQELNEKLESYNKKYGVDFQLTSLASLQLISRFSGKYKRILEAKKEVIHQYQELAAYYEDHAYFDFNFRSLSERRNLAKWTPELAKFREALDGWLKVLPEQIKKELLRLSPTRTKASLGMESDMLGLEQALEKEITELNSANIFKESFKNVMLTLHKQQSYLESIVEKVEQTQVFLKDFLVYFQWKKCWMSLNSPTREVIRALTKVKPEDWLTAFKSWFLYHRLSRAFNEELPDPSISIKEFGRLYEQYCQQLPLQIEALWANRIERVLKEWKSEDKAAYQSFFYDTEEDARNYFSWIDQILQNFSKLTQQLPLFLSSPAGADQLLKATSFKFDYAILLDGGLQSLQDAQPVFHLSHKTLILENPSQKSLPKHQQPLSDFLHELPSVSLVDPTENLASPLSSISMGNIRLLSSEGQYDEQEEVNMIEAQKVFQLLQEVEQSPQRTYPKVHIVCMTKAQRDLIYGYLLDIKQRNLPDKEKIQHLERNGLTVYCLDEIPLPEADYLIISSTYGYIDDQKTLSTKLSRWQKKGFNIQISQLLRQAYKDICILHSLPLKEFDRLLQDHTPYVDLLAHLEEKDSPHAAANSDTPPSVLGDLSENLSSKLYFAKEVGEQLKPYLDRHRLELTIDILETKEIILIFMPDAPEKKVGILPDGFLGHSPSTHFTWENQQLERYQRQGIHLIPSYAISWWNDAKQEIDRLVKEVIDILH